MIFDGWKFPNEAVDQNDFETSELYIHEWSKNMILRNDFQTVSTPSKSFPKVGVMILSYDCQLQSLVQSSNNLWQPTLSQDDRG